MFGCDVRPFPKLQAEPKARVSEECVVFGCWLGFEV